MAQDIIAQAMEILNPSNKQTMEEQNTQNAATLGLGFHQFDGNVSVKEVIEQIGANFTVRADKLVRLPQDILEKALNGEPVTIDPKYLIKSHKATVHDGFDQTIGIVGSDYGVIQNNVAFDLLDMMCNASITNDPLKIVSAGLVHETFDPYMQAILPSNARINGDNSDTQFYVFAHTSHDGTSGLQIRFSPVRVICQNTFLMNVSSKLGFTTKHSKYASERVDLTKEVNVKRVQEIIKSINFLKQDYVDQMNAFALTKVTDKDIEEYVLNLFIKEEDIKREARLHNYNLDLVEGASTRTKNIIKDFKDTLESGVGQDTNRGSKLWLFNGTTNFYSNVAAYGSAKDTSVGRATKRFDSMLSGTANKRVATAMELLAA